MTTSQNGQTVYVVHATSRNGDDIQVFSTLSGAQRFACDWITDDLPMLGFEDDIAACKSTDPATELDNLTELILDLGAVECVFAEVISRPLDT